jgi:cysteine desulfuration protein SufE
MSLAAKQAALIEDLNFLPDAQERLAEVVRRGARHSLPEDNKVESNRVEGCVSKVWLLGGWVGGTLSFSCDAESPMVKGLAALLCDLYSGATPAEVVAVEPLLWQACGLHKMLSPTRLNGLAALRAKIRAVALINVSAPSQ